MINVITSSRYTTDRKRIRLLVREYLNQKGIGDEYVLNVVFVGKNKMKTITAKYKHEDQALPVLSFSYGKLLGEVIVCYPLAVILAAERSKKVDDMIVFLIKHGIDNLLK